MFSLHLKMAAILLRLPDHRRGSRIDFLDDLGLTREESTQVDKALQDYRKMPREYSRTVKSWELIEYLATWLEEKSELAMTKPVKGIPLYYDSIENKDSQKEATSNGSATPNGTLLRSTQIPDWLKLLLNQTSGLEIFISDSDPSRGVVFGYKIPWAVLLDQIGKPRQAVNLDKALDLVISINLDDDSGDYFYFIGIWNIEKAIDLHSASSIRLPNFKAIASCSEFFQDLAKIIAAAEQLQWI